MQTRFCGMQRRASRWWSASVGLIGMLVAAFAPTAAVADAPWVHAISMHGLPRHPADMAAFPYARPDAPKGGRLRVGVRGSYDSLNIFSFKGEKAAGLRNYVYESLLVRAGDEPFSLYGLIARAVALPDDRRSIAFRLDPAARFSDGHTLTADDVVFTHALLRDRGTPNQRGYYAKVDRVDVKGSDELVFHFKPQPDGTYDRELPLIIGLMPILPKHAIDLARFDETTLTPPIGSGPYIVEKVDQGRSITYRRNATWWARDLAVSRGRYNFDFVVYDYFKDAGAHFEAFKSGALDLFGDDDPVRWTSGYDIPAVRDGRIVKREFETRLSAGMNGLAFNLRRPVFQDRRVRDALTLLLDFEWINRSLYANAFKRTQSYFERSDLSSFAQSASPSERALLAGFPDAVAADIMDGSSRLPQTDGSGNDRRSRLAALDLLAAAGYRLDGRRLVHQQTRRPLRFEIISQQRAEQRLLLSYVRALEAVGISATVRPVDSSQYSERIKRSDFDMVWEQWPGTLSPGNEQTFRWGSIAADRPGTLNIVGVKSPAADAMIAALLAARSSEDLTAAARALDRVLRSGSYVIPLFHLPRVWIAHQARLQGPATSPLGGFDVDCWWLDP